MPARRRIPIRMQVRFQHLRGNVFVIPKGSGMRREQRWAFGICK